MRRVFRPLAVILIFLGLQGCNSNKPEKENLSFQQDFSEGWQFRRSLNDGGMTEWEEVKLPHTTRIEPTTVNDQWQGDAWYKKSIQVPADWRGKTILARFEGAMGSATASLNDVEIARHEGGYLPFVIDLTDQLEYGRKNELLIHLDNRDNPLTGPKPLDQLDFNMYGGLYRGAVLKILNPVHISDEILENRVAGGGQFVVYPYVSTERAKVSVRTHVKNTSAAVSRVRLRHLLYYGDELKIEQESQKQELAAGSDRHVTVNIDVNDPILWSPRDPNLYRLETEVYADGNLVEQRVMRIGIRRIEITREGFRINGEKMFLRGVNRHQEYPYIGYALSANADYRDAVKIKEAGFDYVRLSHYPHSPAFMDAADELGLVVMDAILGWQYYNDQPAFTEYVTRACRDLIRRDRNHPSVIAWECSLNETAMPVSLVREFNRIVHEEFPGDQAYSAGWLNDGFDIYVQARQHRLKHYEEPDRPYVVSEYGDWEYYAQNAGFNQDSWADLQPEARTSRQLLSAGEARLLQQATNIQEAHNDNFNTPAFADGYWVMFDYNRGYADDIESSGIMSLHRLPKYSYYFFRSQRDASDKSELYKSGPMVFIASQWTKESSPKIRIFSNADEVELFLNGNSKGRKSPDITNMSDNLRHPPFHFDLKDFEAGTLKAVAYINGRQVAEHEVSTPTDPVGIALRLDESGKAPQAGINDTVFVYASIVDEKGTVVPVNGKELSVAIKGEAVIVNPDAIETSAGIAGILVQIRGGRKEILLEVTAKEGGLKPAVLTFIPR
ncbi:glycoside hydrolase family 2 TIM barrel-domain containing protein [Emcibacter sp.]|uniref:glycoside hydrolase family 2 TIM barrel-domain containing protein n=1 Tax=Emcibacter sp. TaxID=1979954 RepID=UPI003A93D4C1